MNAIAPTLPGGLLTLEQAGELLGGLSAEKVSKLIKNNQLSGVDVGLTPGSKKPRWRIRPEEIEAFLRRRETFRTPGARRRRSPPPVEGTQFFAER